MAKTKTTTVKEIIPDGVEEGIDSSLVGIEDDFILAKITEDYPDAQIKVKVYKAGVFQFSTSEKVDEEMCQQYGGGKYALHFLVNGKPVHKLYMEVAEPVKKTGTGAAVTDAASIQNQMLRDQLQWNQQMILALLGKQGPVTPPTPMQDIVMAWNVLNGSSKSALDPTQLIIKGIELADRVSGKGGDGGDWKAELFRTLREVAPAVIQSMPGNQNPNNNGGTPAPMIQATQTPLVSDQQLKQGLAWLKTRIISGFPVGLALDWLIANSNDPQYQPFIAMGLQKTFQDVINVDPEFANEPFNTWTRQLLDGIKEHFKAMQEQEPEENESA